MIFKNIWIPFMFAGLSAVFFLSAFIVFAAGKSASAGKRFSAFIIKASKNGTHGSEKIVGIIEALSETGLIGRVCVLQKNKLSAANELITKAGSPFGLNVRKFYCVKIFFPVVCFTGYLLLSAVNFFIMQFFYFLPGIINFLSSHGAIDGKITYTAADLTGSGGLLASVLIFLFSLLTYFLPDIYLFFKAKNSRASLLNELGFAEEFIVKMLYAGVYTVQEIIGVTADTTLYLKPYFQSCYNEFFMGGEKAIHAMSEKVNDESFGILCETLVQCLSYDKKNMAVYVDEHLTQVKQLNLLKRRARSGRKPLIFTVLVMFPLIAFIILQIYPWLIQAVGSLGFISFDTAV